VVRDPRGDVDRPAEVVATLGDRKGAGGVKVAREPGQVLVSQEIVNATDQADVAFTSIGSVTLDAVGLKRKGVQMRKINAWLFVTLDSVIEAPEKWVMADDDMFAAVEADYAKSDALLLGRRTYETFAASWPERGSEVPNADWMNNTRKYVASTTLEAPEWNNSTVIKGDVAEAVARLKQEDGKDIMVNGSGALVRSLMRDHLLDELRLFMHPVVVGSGRRLFDDEGDPVKLALVDSHAYATGVISLTYMPTDTSDTDSTVREAQ
jgi:dihydrofolate reductase